MEAKADPNWDDLLQNDSPLHYAVKYGATKVCAALVRAGAELDKELKNGWTPLHVAAQESTPEILDILLNGKKSLPKRLLGIANNQGCTALHLAAIYNRADNAAWLLKHKANPFLFHMLGNTALHEAAKAGATDVIKVILKAGVPTELKNEEGFSARQVSELTGQDAAVKVLCLAEKNPLKIKKNSNEENFILAQQEQILQQKKEIEQLRLRLDKINQESKQGFSEIKLLLQEDSKSGSDNKKSLSKPYGQHPFFSQSISPQFRSLVSSTKLDPSYLLQCYNSRSDGRFERIENVALYLVNDKFDTFPKLSLEEALALTLQESINLRRCYPLITGEPHIWMSIEQAKELKDQESDNLTGIEIDIVQDGLMTLDEVIHLTKSEKDFIDNAFLKADRDVEESVAAFKKHRAGASTSSPAYDYQRPR